MMTTPSGWRGLCVLMLMGCADMAAHAEDPAPAAADLHRLLTVDEYKEHLPTETTLPTAAPDRDVPIVLVCDYSFFPTRMISMTMQAYPVLKASGYRTMARLNLWLRDDQMVSAEEQARVLEFEGTSVD